MSTLFDAIMSAGKPQRDAELSLHVGSGSLGTFFDNLDTNARLNLYALLQRLIARHNALLRRIQVLEGATAQAQTPPEQPLALLEERLTRLEGSLDAMQAARAKGDMALADLGARCNALADRYQSAIDKHLDALTAHFGGGFAEIAAARDTIAESAAEARKAADLAKAVLEEVRDEYAAARDAIPRLADQAVRDVVAAIEEEPGILALALGNAQSFTSTIAKTVER
jgi:chromosome segregation ATPase